MTRFWVLNWSQVLRVLVHLDGVFRFDTYDLLSRAAEMTGPLKAWHAEFLQTLMAEYSGEKLTKVTQVPDKLKTRCLTNIVYDHFYLTGVGVCENFARRSAGQVGQRG